MTDEILMKKAKIRVGAKLVFRIHVTAFICVNILLIGIYLATGRGNYFWPIWVISGWGIGLLMHIIVHTLLFGKTSGKAVQAEYQRLKEGQKMSVFMVLAVIGILASCVTVQERMLPQEERGSVEVIGRVNTTFLSLQMRHRISSENIAERAYSKLMEEARKKYHGNIDVVNITADGNFHPLTLLPLPCGLGIWGNFQTVNASGDVILYSGAFSSGISQ